MRPFSCASLRREEFFARLPQFAGPLVEGLGAQLRAKMEQGRWLVVVSGAKSSYPVGIIKRRECDAKRPGLCRNFVVGGL
jgi:hypothetical protein